MCGFGSLISLRGIFVTDFGFEGVRCESGYVFWMWHLFEFYFQIYTKFNQHIFSLPVMFRRKYVFRRYRLDNSESCRKDRLLFPCQICHEGRTGVVLWGKRIVALQKPSRHLPQQSLRFDTAPNYGQTVGQNSFPAALYLALLETCRHRLLRVLIDAFVPFQST